MLLIAIISSSAATNVPTKIQAKRHPVITGLKRLLNNYYLQNHHENRKEFMMPEFNWPEMYIRIRPNMAYYVDKFINACFRNTVNPNTFVIALIYMKRFLGRTGLSCDQNNVHILFAASFVVAQKWYDDTSWKNRHYSNVAGIFNKRMQFIHIDILVVATDIKTQYTEMNAAEKALLRGLQWDVHVDQDQVSL